MYKYYAKIEIEDAVDMCEEYLFQIVVKENVPFKILDCYFVVKKNHEHEYNISDYLEVRYFSEYKNLDKARLKIKRAVELFIFMTEIPFSTNSFVSEEVCEDIPIINIEFNSKKMLHIKEVDRLYNSNFAHKF